MSAPRSAHGLVEAHLVAERVRLARAEARAEALEEAARICDETYTYYRELTERGVEYADIEADGAASCARSIRGVMQDGALGAAHPETPR